MKAVQVTLRFDAPGGVETNVREVTTRLRRLGTDVRVFASDLYDESAWERRSTWRSEVEGVPVRRFPVYRRLLPGITMPLLPGLIDALVEERPQVIHAHSHRYGHVLQSAAAAQATGIPLVVSTHYHPADRREPGLKRGLLRIQDVGFGATAYRVAKALVVETELEATRIREFAPAQHIRVIPPGVDLDEWRGTADTDRPPADLPRTFVLYAGRIASNKGLAHLVEALSRIRPGDRPALVLMGRDWGERTSLERRAHELGVGDAVHFLGHVETRGEWRAVFRRARCFVLPSEWEAFGLVLLEAMAARCPIVATRVGGVPEVLEGGRAGRLVPYGDPDALAAAILEVLTRPDLVTDLTTNADRRVESLTWDRAAASHLALYRELAGTA